MTLELSEKKKEWIRFSLYLVSALLIVYFIYDIGKTATSIDDQLLELQEEKQNSLNLNYQVEYKELNLNNELGGKILRISFNLIQIIFLTMFIVLLLIFEINDKRRRETK